MISHPTSLPKALEQSADSIFFEKPANVKIDEDARSRYASSQKIETLIEELKEKGPLVALGKMGPSAYADAPFKLEDKVCAQNVYGWKPGTERKAHASQSYAMVLGAKKIEDREYVYFTMSQDITTNSTSYTRKHKPSGTDTKVYVTSHKTFRNYLFDLYPTPQSSKEKPPEEMPVFFISSQPKISPKLSVSERKYVEQLSSIKPLDSILDRDEGEARCKAIGQEIFNKYKEEAGGKSMAGKEAAQRICDAVVFIASDGALRKQYIERAWDGIGDANWDWRA